MCSSWAVRGGIGERARSPWGPPRRQAGCGGSVQPSCFTWRTLRTREGRRLGTFPSTSAARLLCDPPFLPSSLSQLPSLLPPRIAPLLSASSHLFANKQVIHLRGQSPLVLLFPPPKLPSPSPEVTPALSLETCHPDSFPSSYRNASFGVCFCSDTHS